MQAWQDMRDWIEDALPNNLSEIPTRVGQSIYDYTEVVYHQLTKYGNPVPLPTLEQIEEHLPTEFLHSLPGIRSHPVPIPPPPPQSLWQKAASWADRNQRTLYIVTAATTVGLSTSWAYRNGHIYLPGLSKRISHSRKATLRTPTTRNGARREVVVVIGADTPLGRALALHLSTLGFVVIASVSSHSALSAFNSIVPPSSRGYIKALQYDTSDVAGSLDKFIRSVDETLRLRFPLLSAGDPYAAPGDEVSLVGIVNALSYVAPNIDIGRNSTLAFQNKPAELAESLEKHIAASLCAISSLHSLVVSSRPGNGRSNGTPDAGPPSTATVISLLSSPVSHTSLPGAGVESVISQAVAAGMEVIRREVDDRTAREAPALLSTLLPPSRRTTRVTTLEIDEGRPWGSAAVQPQPASEQKTNDSTPTRPPALRKVSTSSTWQTRDVATQAVLAKVGSLLLTPDPASRLKASYRVYLPGGQQHFLSTLTFWLTRGTQRVMRILPTSWVDVVLALRRHVSLRRAGVINAGPRKISSASASSSSNSALLSASGQAGRGSTAPTTQVGPSPASASHSRASLNRSTASHRGAAPSRNAARQYHSFSASSDDGFGDGVTSGPPSLPDSNSGESGSFPDADEGMISSGVWSNYSSSDQQHRSGARNQRPSSWQADSSLTGNGGESVSTSGSTLPRVASRDGPWMGPSSRNSPLMGATSVSSSVAHSPLVPSGGAAEEEEEGTRPSGTNAAAVAREDADASHNPALLGESWVRLGDSQSREQNGHKD